MPKFTLDIDFMNLTTRLVTNPGKKLILYGSQDGEKLWASNSGRIGRANRGDY